MAASPRQQHGRKRAPSVAYIICAACGPLSENHARQAGVQLEGLQGVRSYLRCYSVKEPVPFPLLHTWVQASPEAQEALERIDALRSRSGAKVPKPTHEEMAGSARAALLLGRDRDFLRHYHRYTEERPYEWHPDRSHILFWSSVLGDGWAGGEAVPEGEARAELRRLTACAQAFFPPQAGAAGAEPTGEEWVDVAMALQRMDAAALEAYGRDGSAAALAAGRLLAGDAAAAQAEFEKLFGRSEDNCYIITQRLGLPLLTYALVGGVLAAGSPRFLRAWWGAARYAVPYAFPLSMEREQRQFMRFLDHLERVDALVNRAGVLTETPCADGALSLLPFALAWRALPGYVRDRIDKAALEAAVRELRGAGLQLLARYGAEGLGLEAPTIQPPLPKPVTERACEALLESLRRYERQGRAPLQVPDATTPMLVAGRTTAGVVLNLAEAELLYAEDTPPALRCLRKYADKDLVALEGCSAAEFTRLFVALQAQVDVVGRLARPEETLICASPEPVMLLAHGGGGEFHAALRLRLLPGSSVFLTPGCGLEVPVLEDADGIPHAVKRDSAQEWKLMEKAAAALRRSGLEGAESLLQGPMAVHGFAALAELLRSCRELQLPCCWEKGRQLRLHQPPGGLSLRREGAGDWLEIGGELPVDEGRVLEMGELLAAFAAREGSTLALGNGEYVLLNPALERQLALLELVVQEKKGRQGVAAAAIPLLEALEAAEKPVAELPPPAELPAGLQATLRPYQAEGYRWLAERAAMGLGALLADDMGLGKTVQVLALLLHAAAQPGAGPALVVAPVSLLGNWAEEAARFAPSLRVLLFDSRKPEALAEAGPGSLVLASYGQVLTGQKSFAAKRWDLLVLDEAQAVKNPDSQRAKAVCALRARARICLTGTPVENSLLDLWSQMRFLNPGLLGTRAAFQRRFRKMRPQDFALLRQVLAPLVLRRSKADVLRQLPPFTETVEWVEFSPEERALYESLRRAAVDKLEQGRSAAAGGIGILAELTRLRRACCHGRLALEGFAGGSAKLAAMVERLEELRAAGRRVLIFSQFTDVLDLAQEALQAAGISYLRLDGSTPAAQRSKLVRQFQEGSADAFLISLKAGGAGLNLTAADYVMLLDPWWNPAVEAQAAGRSHRMGQAQPVTLCRFMVRDTVEERILALHKEKKELAESVLSGSAEALTLANLRALLG